jgi:anti-anti-sigma regulatory factor
MKNEIIFDNVKFWLDQHIIHCSFNSKFDERFLEYEIEDLFIEVISSLSIGNFKPILIDLTEVTYLNSISLYKFLSRSTQIKSSVLSKSFLVRSMDLKILLSLYNFGSIEVVPNKICTNFNMAVNYCNEKHQMFNAAS